MSGTKDGAQKRIATIYVNDIMNGREPGASFSKWGKKGAKLTTGGFSNMSPEEVRKASAKGVEARRRNRESNNKRTTTDN